MSNKLESEYTKRHVNFVCTPQQRENIKTMAAAVNLTPSKLLRKLVDEEYDRLLSQQYLKNLELTLEVANV